MITGNDISSWQGDIDWNTYKNNTNFVIIRSTYGNGYTDTKFFRNRDEARRLGIPRGFYHYCYPQYNLPEAEADWFLKTINVEDGESLYLDYEENWSGDKVDWCYRFLDRITSHLNGYKALIYLNQSLASGNDWTKIVNAGHGLWIAAYTYDPTINTFKIGNWKFAAMQQWTSSQQVPGIAGNVDGNVFFGDVNAFKAYGYKAPTPSPIPVPIPAPPTPTPPPVPVVDYKPYLVDIKGVLNGKGWPWQKTAKIKTIINSSGV
jgi:lysozyme